MDLARQALAQTITGNAKASMLNGLGGSDTLPGGGGADIFVFNTTLAATNIDRIADFNVAADTIHLENLVFTGLAAGALAAAFRANTKRYAGDATDRIIYDTDTGALLFDADGSGAGARFQFAALAPGWR